VSDWIVEYYDEGEEDWAEVSGARFEEITDEDCLLFPLGSRLQLLAQSC